MLLVSYRCYAIRYQWRWRWYGRSFIQNLLEGCDHFRYEWWVLCVPVYRVVILLLAVTFCCELRQQNSIRLMNLPKSWTRCLKIYVKANNFVEDRYILSLKRRMDSLHNYGVVTSWPFLVLDINPLNIRFIKSHDFFKLIILLCDLISFKFEP